MSRSHTRIGEVFSVSGSTLLVELEAEMAGVSPIWEGQLHTVGQVGTMVLLPQGTTRLLGIVTRLSLAHSTVESELAALQPDQDSRFIEVQLVGEIDALGRFERGVSNHPGINDPVMFVSSDHLETVYPKPDDSHVLVGELSANRSVKVSLDLEKLVMRHSAVVGSTGSGKSSVVSSILQSIASGPWKSANVVVIDSHGEYKTALTSHASVVELATAVDPLIPAWLLTADDILDTFTQSAPTSAVRQRFSGLVTDARRRFAASAGWLSLPPDEINADSPIPFDMNQVWFDLDTANRLTYDDSAKTIPALVRMGAANTLTSSDYKPHTPVNSSPYKSTETLTYGTFPDQIRRSLMNPRLAFLGPGDLAAAQAVDPVPELARRVLGGSKTISLIDVSGVASNAANLAVGTILRLIFELAWHSGDDGIGRNSPVLLVVEEAHRYFNDTQSGRSAKQYIDRVAREGRKYGVGLMLVTQRPSELPKTALSQVGTFIALRLSNESDQGTVSSALPDGIADIASSLPGLRTGEAIVVGEALPLPSRVSLAKPLPWPRSDDPKITTWLSSPKGPIVGPAIKKWRESQ